MYLKIKEILLLLWIHFKFKVQNFIEFIRVVISYYPHVHFAKIDLALLFSYFFSNPFRVAKRFLKERGEEDYYTYGETPLTTLQCIANRCEIGSSDVVFELGCGRGRTCFWLNAFLKCKVVGIDYVPLFILKANQIKKRFRVENVSFILDNFFEADLTGATVIYLYASCLSEAEIQILAHHLSSLAEGTKIISVSYPLTHHLTSFPFKIIKKFSASFSWGHADVFLQEKSRPHHLLKSSGDGF